MSGLAVATQQRRGLCSAPTNPSTFGNYQELREHRRKEADPLPSLREFSLEGHSGLRRAQNSGRGRTLCERTPLAPVCDEDPNR